jgi:cytokinin dehydrogenase
MPAAAPTLWGVPLIWDNRTVPLLELRVVTGRGERVSCSPERNPRLFDAVRAGLGQVAVVTGVTLPLVPAPRMVRRFLLHYPDLATMLGDQRLLAGLADDRPMAQPSTLPYLDYLDRLAALEQALRANGQWEFPPTTCAIRST